MERPAAQSGKRLSCSYKFKSIRDNGELVVPYGATALLVDLAGRISAADDGPCLSTITGVLPVAGDFFLKRQHNPHCLGFTYRYYSS